MASGVGRKPFASYASKGLNAHASACITHFTRSEIRRRISASPHSLHRMKAIPLPLPLPQPFYEGWGNGIWRGPKTLYEPRE